MSDKSTKTPSVSFSAQFSVSFLLVAVCWVFFFFSFAFRLIQYTILTKNRGGISRRFVTSSERLLYIFDRTGGFRVCSDFLRLHVFFFLFFFAVSLRPAGLRF